MIIMDILLFTLLIFLTISILYKLAKKNILKFALWSDELNLIFKTLKAAGGTTYIVGGAVRNFYLGLPLNDIDLCSTLVPEKIILALKKAGITCIPTGIAHGTITALINGKTFEITTLRSDIKTDGRHAQVKFTKDIKLDAARRDFTINALYLNEQGKLYDFWNGLSDLKKHQLNFIGNPKDRLNEDYLRLLRYFRFLAVLGWQPDKHILHIAAEFSPKINLLSQERVRDEILKILASSKPQYVMQILQNLGILKEIFANKLNLSELDEFIAYEKKFAILSVWRRLHYITHPQITHQTLGKILKLSKAQTLLLKSFALTSALNSITEIKKSLFLYGYEATFNQLLKQRKTLYLLVLRFISTPQMPNLAQALIKNGFKGAAISTHLNQAQKLWLDSNFKLSAKDLLKKVLKN